MPELPEVETTCRGIAPHVTGRWIRRLAVHDRRLRWPVAADLPRWAKDQQITRRAAARQVHRHGSGTRLAADCIWACRAAMRMLPASTARETHDHFDVKLDSGWTLRFNDPRRFGSLHHGKADVRIIRCCGISRRSRSTESFDADYLHYMTRGKRRVAIKLAIMNSQLVVGVGNIYASEALFRAASGRGARRRIRWSTRNARQLVAAIKAVLGMAIEHGGTTLRDYVGAGGQPGYFRQKLFVYERAGEPCRQCGTPVRHRVQGQRSTYFCTVCQQ